MSDLTAQTATYRSGDDHTLEVTVRDGAGAVVDIDGASITFGVYRSVISATAEFTYVTGESPSEVDIVDGPNGRFNVYLQKEDSDALSGDYYMEAQLTDGFGQVTTVMVGTLTIKEDAI